MQEQKVTVFFYSMASWVASIYLFIFIKGDVRQRSSRFIPWQIFLRVVLLSSSVVSGTKQTKGGQF